MTATYDPIEIPPVLAGLSLPAESTLEKVVDEYLEDSPRKIRDRISFWENEIAQRVMLRNEQYAQLQQTICEINTAFFNMEPFLWTEIDEIARKEVANLLKSRREVYSQQNDLMNRAWKDIHEMKVELLEARQQYQALKKQSALLGITLTGAPNPVMEFYGGAAPVLADRIP